MEDDTKMAEPHQLDNAQLKAFYLQIPLSQLAQMLFGPGKRVVLAHCSNLHLVKTRLLPLLD